MFLKLTNKKEIGIFWWFGFSVGTDKDKATPPSRQGRGLAVVSLIILISLTQVSTLKKACEKLRKKRVFMRIF